MKFTFWPPERTSTWWIYNSAPMEIVYCEYLSRNA